MKKSIWIVLLNFAFVLGYSQNKDISTAKSLVRTGKNLPKAEQLMRDLLADSVNRQNDRIWTILFESIRKQYENENEKLYLKQKYDTISLFMQTQKMFSVLDDYDKAMAARSDKRGKEGFAFKKKYTEILDEYRPNLYNGGLFFLGKQKYDTAYRFFDEYINTAHRPLFSSFHYLDSDKLLPEAAYWAVYCGYKLHNPKATLHHSYLALKDTANYCLMLQYLAETYRAENDTARYFSTLKEGFYKYPSFPYFFPRLVEHYSRKNDYDSALAICDYGLAVDSTNQNYLFAKSTILLNTSQYDKCLTVCLKLISLNDSFPDAFLNAALVYYNQAIELDKNYSVARSQHANIIRFYREALKYFERYQALAPDRQDRWALPLYTIYLNLNMGKEFDNIDKILRNMKK